MSNLNFKPKISNTPFKWVTRFSSLLVLFIHFSVSMFNVSLKTSIITRNTVSDMMKVKATQNLFRQNQHFVYFSFLSRWESIDFKSLWPIERFCLFIIYNWQGFTTLMKYRFSFFTKIRLLALSKKYLRSLEVIFAFRVLKSRLYIQFH